MRRSETAYLQLLLDAILQVESYLLDLDEAAFLGDARTQDAVVRQLEIIREATKKLSPEIRGRSPATPWQDIAGMRDKLIHDYFDVDLRRVWNTAKRDLPPLKAPSSSSSKSTRRASFPSPGVVALGRAIQQPARAPNNRRHLRLTQRAGARLELASPAAVP
jgi:uncharacterized protein with HEPN domain